MKEEIIRELPDLLRTHICTLKKASLDESKMVYMCDSPIKVINFDKVPAEYSRGRGWKAVPNSNDALYVSEEGIWYFIEFKNGNIDKSNIYRKLYDSIIMLIDTGIIPNLEFVRNNVEYILVYNSEKKHVVPESDNRTLIFSTVLQLARTEETLFGIDHFEKYLFKRTHTYTKEAFVINFIIPIERKEGIAAG